MDRSVEKGADILDQLNAGDINALQHLFAVYFVRLNDFAAHVIKDNDISQDIVIEVFEKVWENHYKIENINIEDFNKLL